MSLRKRFYKSVSVDQDASGIRVQLDGRMLRTPARREMALPNLPMAQIIAAEWDSQRETIDPATMPMFSLAVTVLDRVTPQRRDLVAEMRSYGGNDLLCYRADDAVLSAREQAEWQPWLEWSATTLDAPLVVAQGIMPVTQSKTALTALEAAINAHDDWELGMLHRVVALGGSLVLGLAFLRGEMDHETLFQTAFLNELWQAENWGSDFEAEDRRQAIQNEMTDVAQFLRLRRGEG